MSYTKIYAPIDGRIGKSTYTVGNYITPGSKALADIVQDAPVYVMFSISEPDFLRLFGSAEKMKKEGIVRLRTADRKDYQDTGDGKDTSIGKVTLVDNTVDSATGTLKIWVTFANRNLKLIPGGLVDVYISRKSSCNYASVPAAAVMQDKSGNYVYLVNSSNVVERREVETAGLIGDTYLIQSGLNIGDTVIVDGIHKTRPAATVVPVSRETSNQTGSEAK